MYTMTLSNNWRIKKRDSLLNIADDVASSDGWIPARVPGTVHEALLDAGLIADPFYGRNEHDAQWVGEQDWLYYCTFSVDQELLAHGPIALCCDGLDTIATVYLNNVQVLSSDNMFVPARVDVTRLLNAGENILAINFASALHYGKQQEAEHGQRAVWNGDASRVYIRKAQYHYGWDWGPCLLTAGPWKPIRLEAGSVRLAEISCPVHIDDDLQQATIPVTIQVEHADQTPNQSPESVEITLVDPQGTVVAATQLDLPGNGSVQHTLLVDNPALWWPNGYGEQPLYTVTVQLRQNDTLVDSRTQRIGIRRLQLQQEPFANEPGTSFVFVVNNTPIFCGGANWIPADSFVTRLTPQDYRQQLAQAVDANMVMLRVWGGGIYEHDTFYDNCDELGLMVWQDFMFACGIYPAHPSFQENVRAEASAQVRRLRHHPSLVLWCGNNEDYQIAESLKAYDITFNGDFTMTTFPARALYEHVLPEVCADLDPTRPYWPGSPYGGTSTTDKTIGDRHTWDIWHGQMAPYHEYKRFAGRFVSEFGMQSCAALSTIEASTEPAERYPQSRTMDHHNKASDGPRRLAVYLNDTVRVKDTIEDYVYATQFMQSEALLAAYQAWRRQWRGPGEYRIAGALVWQLNDCWPVTSWSIVDYARIPKPAYYTIRRALAPLSLGLAVGTSGVEVWAVNASLGGVAATLEVIGYALDGTKHYSSTQSVTLAPNQATELGPHQISQHESLVVAARLSVDGEVQARTARWSEPYKYLTLPDPGLSVDLLSEDHLIVRASRPAKGVWLTVPHSADNDVVWSDNMLDVLPNDPQTIHAVGLHGRAVRACWLQQ